MFFQIRSQFINFLQSIFHLAAMQFCEVKSVYSSYGKLDVLTSTGIFSQNTHYTSFGKSTFNLTGKSSLMPVCVLQGIVQMCKLPLSTVHFFLFK